MKISFFLTLLLFFIAGLGIKSTIIQAQTLYFCEDVDEDGYPVNESTSFTIPSSGGWLKFLIRMDEEIDCSEVKYVIYKVSRSGKEKYETTIYQDVEDDWVWFWKKVTFYDEGNYNVYVYNENDKFLTSNSVRINYK